MSVSEATFCKMCLFPSLSIHYNNKENTEKQKLN